MANTTGPRQDTMSEVRSKAPPPHVGVLHATMWDTKILPRAAGECLSMKTSLTTTVRLGFTLTPKKCSDIPRSTLQTKKWQKTHTNHPVRCTSCTTKRKIARPSASPSKTPGLGVLLVGGRPMKQRKNNSGSRCAAKI